jgi:hypothetical protein
MKNSIISIEFIEDIQHIEAAAQRKAATKYLVIESKESPQKEKQMIREWSSQNQSTKEPKQKSQSQLLKAINLSNYISGIKKHKLKCSSGDPRVPTNEQKRMNKIER